MRSLRGGVLLPSRSTPVPFPQCDARDYYDDVQALPFAKKLLAATLCTCADLFPPEARSAKLQWWRSLLGVALQREDSRLSRARVSESLGQVGDRPAPPLAFWGDGESFVFGVAWERASLSALTVSGFVAFVLSRVWCPRCVSLLPSLFHCACYASLRACSVRASVIL